ncbi:hypothetical protein [Nocardioides humi]|uniref:Dolichyl-phosphate-mannose-protein mannosyltransferase n=1 Tax=Nocardioides humi TaxID=449461 RepID=A0ABN2AQ45_9ACTN|nr:hypothetical protein [Nocardioides humi]
MTARAPGERIPGERSPGERTLDERAPGGPAEPRFPLVARALPLAGGALLTALLIAWDRRPFRAFDTYFHLRFGDEFRHGWSIGHPGQPSPASTNDWAPTQWLPQVGLSWIADVGGRTGLVIVFAVLSTGLTAALYLLLRRHAGPGVSLLLAAIVLIGLLPSLSLRPQVLSYAFLIALLAAWDSARRTGRVPWLLVPLGWLWATCHGMWIIGVAASALLAVLVVLERRPDRRRAVVLLLVPLGMLAAALVTPVGPRLLTAVVQVNSRGRYFAEWGVPEILTLGSAPLAVLLAAAVLLLVRRTGVAPYDIGLLALGGAFSVYSGRTVPLALITLAVVVAAQWGRRRERPPTGMREYAVVALLAGAALAAAPFQTVVEDPADDVRPFAAALAALPDGSRVVTDWPTGGVLLWTEPQLDVPLHGYGDVYTDDELERYAGLARLEPGWDQTLARLAPRAALLPEDERLSYALRRDGWQVLQRSGDLVLLVPPADEA